MIFRDIYKIIQEKTDTFIFDFHSLMIKTYINIKYIIKRLINEQFSKMQLNRFTENNFERVNLYIMSIEKLDNIE